MAYVAEATTKNNEALGAGVNPAEDLWVNFVKPMVDFNTYVNCDSLKNVAQQVLAEFDLGDLAATLPGNIGTNPIYGTLPDFDIKRMDAATALSYSLMEESFQSTARDALIEPIVDANGAVNFVEIGKSVASVTDVYYSMQTATYKDAAPAVMVMGGKPTPTFRPVNWIPIWAGEGTDGADIFAQGSMLANCTEEEWKSYATIAFSDPNLDSKYDDGIDNLYEITDGNPWDRIMGYGVYVEPPPSYTTLKTTIQYASETDIPLKIATAVNKVCNVGTLYTVNSIPAGEDPECWQGLGGTPVEYEKGVPVEIPDKFRFEDERGEQVDKFVSVTGVFVVGQAISTLYARPKTDALTLREINNSNSDIWLSVNSTRRTVFKLEEKKQYAIAYKDIDDDGFQDIAICFAQDTRPGDKVIYGNGPDHGGTKYYLDPFSELAKEKNILDTNIQTGTVLPTGQVKGILVEEIWVTVKLESPSITIYDPDGQNKRALQIAENLKYYLGPLVMIEPPAPVGFVAPNGDSSIILQERGKQDNDPTSAQFFDDTPMEEAMDLMQGAGFQITLGFLSGEGIDASQVYASVGAQCKQAAELLWNYMNKDVAESVYTCGPDCNVSLGEQGPGRGIINSIKYNYSDQGAYTISVTEGSWIVGGTLTSVDGGPVQKMAEDFGAKGTVIQVAGDNLHFKVRIDGYGDRWAMNMTHNIIRQGDIVQCAIHNNPVEA